MPMETITGIVLPDFLPYLLAIFGLLVLWQFYQLRVMKGRILAIDIFDRSGIRMYLYAVADGVGGGLNGDVASRMAVDGLKKHQTPDGRLKLAVEKVQNEVRIFKNAAF